MRITLEILIHMNLRMPNAREYKYEWDLLYLKCCWCGEWKATDCYSKNIKWLFGLKSICKDCVRKYHRANKEKESVYYKEYYKTNREKISLRNKDYFANNRERILKRNKDYRDANAEKRNAHNREYYSSNREKMRMTSNVYYQNNKERLAQYRSEYNKRHNDELWFNLATFHTKAEKYARNHSLIPWQCPICWNDEKVEMHHPSYEKYEYWWRVVFCCHSCHKQIHNWVIECPQPINLLTLN